MNANLYTLLRAGYAAALEQDFLVESDGRSTTFGEIDELAARMATVLSELGVGPGDRIVVQVSKSVEAVALYLATLRSGAIYVPLNPAYVEAEVAFFLSDAEPSLFVHDSTLPVPGSCRHESIDRFVDDAATAALDPTVATRLADDLAAMLYTSGTTGRPKGAMLTHANLASNALTLHRLWGFEPGDVLLHVLPIFHVHGLFVALHTALLNASRVVFLERFDIDRVLAHLPEATVMMGVPTHYSRLLADPRFESATCSNMRLFTSGSAPMTAEVHRVFAERTGHTILERYGMTEAGMITSNPYQGGRIAGTVGMALPGVSVRVCDEAGVPVPPGENGVVEVRGPNLFSGYWRLPERTEAEHRSDGYFITGDIGVLDADGRLTLEGRSSDMIISGGLNVYPKEIEAVIDGIDGVLESAVIGVAHADLGEAPVALLVTDVRYDASEAAAAVSDRLARFKRPRRLIEIESLPRNSMGKVQKSDLRARYRNALGPSTQ